MVLADIEVKIGGGEPLTPRDARAILETPDLIAVGVLAEEARRRRHGDRVTFVRVARIPLGGPGIDAALERARNAGEIRVDGPLDDIDAAASGIRRVVEAANGIPVTGFSLAEAERVAAAAGVALGDAVRRLRDAGLALIAEAPLDDLRDPDRAFGAAAEAGLAIARLTIRRWRPDDRIATVLAVEELQRRWGGIRAFAPLAREASDPPSTGYDDVKQVALGRLLAASVDRIQVDWPLHGPKLAQVALMFGADDLDAVPAVDPMELGHRRSHLEEVRRNITAASRVPVERDGCFEVRSS